jgi:hypothetical protein
MTLSPASLDGRATAGPRERPVPEPMRFPGAEATSVPPDGKDANGSFP